ncbi:MAG: hypothetical protein ACSHX5_02500 [Phycisphaerales bacterium]
MKSQYRLIDDDKVQTHIVVQATELVNSGGIRACDREDFEQECRLWLIQIDEQYDPTQSAPITFATEVINNFAKKYIRDSRARKRCPENKVYFQSDCMVDPLTREFVEVSELMDNESYSRRLGIENYRFTELFDLIDYVQHILTQISDEDADLLLEVSRSSVKQTAEWRGVSRYQVKKQSNDIQRRFKRYEEM